MISINVYRIVILVVLCACAYAIIKLLIENKTLKFIHTTANEYGMTPEVIETIMQESETMSGMYETLDKICKSFDEQVIQMVHETNDEPIEE